MKVIDSNLAEVLQTLTPVERRAVESALQAKADDYNPPRIYAVDRRTSH